ncbi:Eco57I restriction-modification methylase domain-containing protein [Chloroflexus sp.]|uniref:Eco57I restriction-modification methylase domain-containing protein n=1 Tax=Chloroflexus sp. TaxID=1904827 RepID=UPI002ACD4DF0|nr:Eco57I restriction-modification methylase domain-containing protein [Chloroflexus sp.]
MQIEFAKRTTRLTNSFEVERVTKRFYEEFKQQREAFQAWVRGIPVEHDRRWYASVILHRLLFVSFLQANGFLNNNPDYLRERLAWSKAHLGPNRYYRDVLRLLFWQGFACEPARRNPRVTQILGSIPYLNSGLFLPHPLEERYGAALDIPDAAFEHLFAFLSGWRWHLNERSRVSERDIDPTVLGYIFEKYLNQKQMGAYYTSDDITDYICRSTIIPALFDKAGLSLAPLALAQNVSKYIYPAMRQDEPLPTETARERALRRARVAAIVADAAAGKITTINDAVTANLDLEALLADLISLLDAPKVYALYTALAGDPAQGQVPLSVLDPTVGSGAFLFAALRILKPIYAAVLDRMDELNGLRQTAGLPFCAALAEADGYPSRDYFITKSIITRNLYGVDLMAEATEICTLRLFLRMIAELDGAHHIEPLPDIDFNIWAGNALVGYAHPAEVKLTGIDVALADAQRELAAYRRAQLRRDPAAASGQDMRQRIRRRLDAINQCLNDELQRAGHLWRLPTGGYNTQPFHWCTAFYEILNSGGFDVIVGNPPYVAYSKVRNEYRIAGYKTEDCGNLYAFVIERALNLLSERGRCGMIVPIASISTEGMKSLQRIYRDYIQWHSNYAVRPGKLFAGVDMNLTITLLQPSAHAPQVYCTSYYRWFSGKQSDRPFLFEKLAYCRWEGIATHVNPLPKIGSQIEVNILAKMHSHQRKLKDFVVAEGIPIYYHSGGRYWRKALLEKLSSHYKPIIVPERLRSVVLALLNSQLFYWYWIVNSNCMDVVSREVLELPVFDLNRIEISPYLALEQALLAAYDAHRTTCIRRGETIHANEIHVDVAQAKPILDQIDRTLATHYGLTEEELDFIIHYDIKYRMGRAGRGDDEDG